MGKAGISFRVTKQGGFATKPGVLQNFKSIHVFSGNCEDMGFLC